MTIRFREEDVLVRYIPTKVGKTKSHPFGMKKQITYTCSGVDKILTACADLGGFIHQLNDGILGCGTFVIEFPNDYPYVVIEEVPINSWSSVHTMRKFKSLPARYWKMIEESEE